ncbi:MULTISPECIES: AIPR family protein [Sorangium]|uniref:AIPR family protein n=1 Tax=Sorangium TaxID=39643 RepID=UPI003D9C16B9
MAKNDTILVDGIIDSRLSQEYPSTKRDEVFELFCLEQLLKDYDLSRDELESGWIDGRNDGGIDGIFTFINGRLLNDASVFPWPRTRTEIVVHITTCKHHETFQQAPLNSLVASAQELLDFSLEVKDFKGAYSDELIKARQDLLHAYRRLSTTNPSLEFHFSYMSRGDTSQLAENVKARADQLVALTRQFFSLCEPRFTFFGASELVALYRRIRSFSLEIRYSEMLSRENASYACLVPLDDYRAFVTDDQGAIRRYLFESNVRDYLGDNAVNEDILNSLMDLSAPDFWWLNNGVTILASAASATGKLLRMEDIQIVNGLQTTETIFRYFQTEGASAQGRCVLVRILVSRDPAVRDRIIRATNSQTLVATAALRATDKTQRDIEDVLERYDWYYERRKNYYRNVGRPPSRFVTPLYIAGGAVAILLRDPVRAAAIRARFMRKDETYQEVFSPGTPMLAWVRIVEILKRSESVISRARGAHGNDGERILARWRATLGLLFVARLFGTFAYNAQQLANITVSETPDSTLEELWSFVQEMRGPSPSPSDHKHKKIRKIIEEFAGRFNVASVELVRGQIPRIGGSLKPDFVDAVDAALPERPWPQGVHRTIAAQLNCEPALVWTAINVLVNSGRRARSDQNVAQEQSGEGVAKSSAQD